MRVHGEREAADRAAARIDHPDVGTPRPCGGPDRGRPGPRRPAPPARARSRRAVIRVAPDEGRLRSCMIRAAGLTLEGGTPRCTRTRCGTATLRFGPLAQSRTPGGIDCRAAPPAAAAPPPAPPGRRPRVGRRGHQARRQTEPAFDAVLETLVRVDALEAAAWAGPSLRAGDPSRRGTVRRTRACPRRGPRAPGCSRSARRSRSSPGRRPPGARERLPTVDLHPARATRRVQARSAGS
jgi:hypothetical protein